ncbi:MAG: hypothetical protein QGG65_08660 [Gammaproteobacteria bacterium]|jgi:hypothetical protein|nr:hypothetical protein [Gammaproteobacteria bacterium]MDP7271397.1 hypothetical protein [Gammaproteobacteria bacterium]
MNTPTCEQPNTKYDGWYKLDHSLKRLSTHNLQSWIRYCIRSGWLAKVDE